MDSPYLVQGAARMVRMLSPDTRVVHPILCVPSSSSGRAANWCCKSHGAVSSGLPAYRYHVLLILRSCLSLFLRVGGEVVTPVAHHAFVALWIPENAHLLAVEEHISVEG